MLTAVGQQCTKKGRPKTFSPMIFMNGKIDDFDFIDQSEKGNISNHPFMPEDTLGMKMPLPKTQLKFPFRPRAWETHFFQFYKLWDMIHMQCFRLRVQEYLPMLAQETRGDE
ncbi:hypothetical protein DPF_0027 [Desulfoplanes formicivorans]|uniref:Uncharacterized protein n=1 Tax=Desulfoplanes formicivorans TaxID=1592317 RepID=A0A194AEY9_9BACT|nr:hypothetical protein DPF_0027 [Desulfoplanes formicivorans]